MCVFVCVVGFFGGWVVECLFIFFDFFFGGGGVFVVVFFYVSFNDVLSSGPSSGLDLTSTKHAH